MTHTPTVTPQPAVKPYHTTKWKKGEKEGSYTTKKLTDYHKRIHEWADKATTLHCDGTTWAFGHYTVIIAVTDKEKPARNQPFETT